MLIDRNDRPEKYNRERPHPGRYFCWNLLETIHASSRLPLKVDLS